MSKVEKTDNQFVRESIQNQFGPAVKSIEESYGMLDIVISKDTLIPVITWLKKTETLRFQFLTSLCGVHYPEQKEFEFSVVYHLHSLTQNIRIRIHIFMPESDLKVPTLTTLFAGANWMERETFEFYGIQFTGHPDLRTILNVEDMNYHPLRKQYPLVDNTRTDKDDKYFGR
ncbi:MAG: NADH-quinone oxidoreductase subunit C [Saprospiraceae bacterium]|jgi:NADH-quinone oxidoreductase subunit C|nr:NADH-quinone oxidoreductase subunit C [Saprospiraceae bacterium]